MAAPETGKTDKASKVESPAQKDAPSPTAPAARPTAGPTKKRKGGLLSKLFFSVAALAILAGGAGYAALTFRDVDPRVGLAASYVEEGLAEAQGALDKAQALIADLSGAPKPASKGQSHRALLDKAPLPPAVSPDATTTTTLEDKTAEEKTLAEKNAESAPPPVPAPTEAEPPAPPPQATRADIPEPPRKPVELAQEAPQPLPPPPVAAAPARAPTPSPAASPAPAAKPVDADGFTDRDLISALEGRIEALSDEVQALRGKLEAPKSETRAPPETDIVKAPPEMPATAIATDSSAAAVVAALALERDLEAGRPFAGEIAALSRLNAEPAPAQILIELSEKGAATGAQLHDAFLPLARKLRTHETHVETHEAGDIAGHLLEGASKLVKVRPAGQAHPDSLDGKLDRIEAALARSDFSGAERIFDSLPEEARAEAKEFGETLRQRAEAASAAEDLLRGALAALGKK